MQTLCRRYVHFSMILTNNQISIIPGFCKRGDSCWFLHVSDHPKKAEIEEDELCSICFEKPVTFGLLGKLLFSR